MVAVDANRETLEVAAEKSWPAHRVEFRIADAYALPDALGEFDAAFAGFYIALNYYWLFSYEIGAS